MKREEKSLILKASSHWTALMALFGTPKSSGIVLESLFSHYLEPHRAYHNLEHIVSMLEEFDSVSSSCEDIASLRFAIWYHDVVYDPRANDNEAKSCLAARRAILQLELPSHFGTTVSDLIMATTHKEKPPSPDACLLADLDLAVLGKSEKVFEQYEAAIRQEYSWVPEADFRAGRGAILRAFLNRNCIYQTPDMRDKYETRARQNLEHSMRKFKS